MTLEAGRRVRLAAELRLAGSLVPARDTSGAAPFAGSLSLAAGAEGTVEHVDGGRRPEPSQEVREYERLKSLLDSFGAQMPPASRERLAEELAALEPAWTAHQEHGLRATLRVRLDNGFVLDDVPEELFTAV
ncbi:hypothetical protein ACGFMM_30650 [Streptomyces sp. NPDC048604]|uniref:hypothetical protein n=1 Tax=Streptomyces sp. NPDC048604 TaxID=3365578 RepID=UPI00371AC030